MKKSTKKQTMNEIAIALNCEASKCQPGAKMNKHRQIRKLTQEFIRMDEAPPRFRDVMTTVKAWVVGLFSRKERTYVI